jgi:hypothetical protein
MVLTLENSAYLGNSNLKRKDTQISWTPEMVQEFIECAQDICLFAKKHIKIVHVDHGLIPIDLYDYQREIILKSTVSRNVIVNTSRQAGKTTTAVVLILHYVLFNDHKTVALLANKGDAAREILDRIKIAYEALPKWLQQGVIEWNKGSVEFENGCKIIASSTSSSAIRGKSVSFLYIDETAFVENWDTFFASVFPTISSGNTTKILLTSTPNGLNHFYKTFTGAKEERNGYAWVEVPWQRVPGRDDNWKQETLAAMDFDTQKFAQEFEGEFIGSSGTLISGAKLKELVYSNPLHDSNGLKIFENSNPKNTYVAIIDVSRGKGLDYSAFHIIDITTMPYTQVCTFRDSYVSPIEYTEIIHRISTNYNDAYVLIEINDIGAQVSDLLYFDYEYENMISTESGGRFGKRISSGFGKSVDRGVRTTKSVKSVGCSILKLLVEQNQLLINDFETINELSTFSKKGVSYEAESGCHDDLAMGLVLFAWLSSQQYFKDLTDINTMAKLRERSEEQLMEDVLPFGFHNDANELMESEAIVLVDRGNGSWLK